MIENLDSENTFHNGAEYDLNLLSKMSPDDFKNMSQEEQERILHRIQGYQKEIERKIQEIGEVINELANDSKIKKSKLSYEHEIRSLLKQKSDIVWIQEFLQENNIDENTNAQTIITLINRSPIVKSVIMNYMQDSLSPEEIEKFGIRLKGKSPNQIQKIFQKKNFQELGIFFSKHSQKLLISAGSALVLVGIVLRLSANNPFKFKSSRKERTNKEVVDTSKSLIQVPDKIIPPMEKIDSVQQLQSWIPDTAIAKGLTLDQVMSSINAIADKSIRIQLIKDIELGDIASAQEIFGMKKTTQYKSNRASGIIDEITLERFKNPLFNLSGDSLLAHKDIPQDVKEIYKKFVSGEYANDSLHYGIISKTNCALYLFTKHNTLVNHQTVLLGSKKGDEEFVLHRSPTTPAGVYRVQQNTRENDGSQIVYMPGYMKNGEYVQEIGTGYLLDLLPIDIVTGKYNHAYDITKGTLAIHPTPSHLREKRKKDIETKDLKSKRETGGCVDASDRPILYDNISAGGVEEGSIIIITQDH